MWGDWCSGGRVGDGASGALQLRVRLASRRIERRVPAARSVGAILAPTPPGPGGACGALLGEPALRYDDLRRRPRASQWADTSQSSS